MYFNWCFFKRFYNILKLMFPSLRSIPVLLFLTLIFVLVLEQLLIFNVGIIASGYYQLLAERNQNKFVTHTIRSLLLVFAIAFVKSTNAYLCNILYAVWRRLITINLLTLYFKNMTYYDLTINSKSPDNPDQRISQDVDKMSLQFSQIFAQLIVSPFTIIYYSWQAWSLTGYIGPISVYVFFILSTFLNKCLMSPVVKLIYEQEEMEGLFRYNLMKIRNGAESVAFIRSGQVEFQKSKSRLEKLLGILKNLFLRRLPLNISINTSDYIGSIFSYMIIGIPIFSGKYDKLTPGELAASISASSFVIMYLINQFTTLIDMADKATTVAGTAHRIGELMEFMLSLPRKCIDHLSTNKDHVNYLIRFTNILADFPNGKPIFLNEFNFDVKVAENVLIVGDSGIGKTTIIRLLACLWKIRSGIIDRTIAFNPQGIFILPQKPFFTDGKLRDNITYPISISSFQTDFELKEILKFVGLNKLLDRYPTLDEEVNCDIVLSPGEGQRLNFARLFYHRPKIAVLDEASSQISEDMEYKLYEHCKNLNITLISIGHRKTLMKFHHVCLIVNENGCTKLTNSRDN